MGNWSKVGADEEIKVGWRRLVKKRFTSPDGRMAEFTIKDPSGAMSVSVVALTEDGRVVIAEQFRPGPERIMQELPGGGVDNGEDLEVAMRRELREETGYTSQEVEYLGYVYKDPYSNAQHHYYLARNCRQTEAQSLDDTEFIDVKLITADELMYNARHGLMTGTEAVFLAYEKLHDISLNKEKL